MDSTDFDRLYEAFGAFHARFAPYFGRREARERSEQYVRGLLVQKSERRSAENLAEAVPGATPRALQRLLTESPWPTEPVVGELQAFVGERLSDPEGVFIPDETGFSKQGKKSVGVTRQYSGTLGQTGNCQVGVFLAYASRHGHALVDGRLYMPEPWTQDPARCRAAGVPEARLGFRTKPELALESLRAAIARGHLEARWVTADEVYGNSPSFRDGLDACGLFYVLEVQSTMPIFEEWAEARLPVWSGRGRPPTQRRLVAGAKPARKVRQVRAGLAPRAWRRLTVAEGSQGPRGATASPPCASGRAEAGCPVQARGYSCGRSPTGASRASISRTPRRRHRSRSWRRWLRCAGRSKRSSRRSRASVGSTSTRCEVGAHGTTMWCWRCWPGLSSWSWSKAGGKSSAMPRHLTRPQVARVLAELLPHERWTTAELLAWLLATQERNERARRSHAKRRRLKALRMQRKPSL